MTLAALLGLTGGMGLVLLRRALDQRAEDAEEIESATGRATAQPFLAAEDPGDGAVETLRSLRTSLQFALLEAPNNIVALTGPTPGSASHSWR